MNTFERKYNNACENNVNKSRLGWSIISFSNLTYFFNNVLVLKNSFFVGTKTSYVLSTSRSCTNINQVNSFCLFLAAQKDQTMDYANLSSTTYFGIKEEHNKGLEIIRCMFKNDGTFNNSQVYLIFCQMCPQSLFFSFLEVLFFIYQIKLSAAENKFCKKLSVSIWDSQDDVIKSFETITHMKSCVFVHTRSQYPF